MREETCRRVGMQINAKRLSFGAVQRWRDPDESRAGAPDPPSLHQLLAEMPQDTSPALPSLRDMGGASAGVVTWEVAEATAQDDERQSSSGFVRKQRSFSGRCVDILRSQVSVRMSDTAKVLRSCAFFKSCSEAFIRELVATGGPGLWRGTRLHCDAVLYEEGDVGSSMYVVARGRGTVVTNSSGVYSKSREIGVGDHLGAAQLLGLFPTRHEEVSALTPMSMLEVPYNIFHQLLKTLRDTDLRVGGGSHPSGRGSKAASQSHYLFVEERKHFERVSAALFHDLKDQPANSGGHSSLPAASPTAATVRVTGLTTLSAAAGGRLHDSLPVQLTPRGGALAMEEALEVQEVKEDTIAVCERLIQRLLKSLRTDMRRGYTMPTEFFKTENQNNTSDSFHRARLGSESPSHSVMSGSRCDSPSHGRASLNGAPEGAQGATTGILSTIGGTLGATGGLERGQEEDVADLMRSLPPLRSLGPVQRLTLLRMLRRQQAHEQEEPLRRQKEQEEALRRQTLQASLEPKKPFGLPRHRTTSATSVAATPIHKGGQIVSRALTVPLQKP